MPTEEARQNRDTRKRVDHLFAVFRFVAIALVVGALAGLGGGALAFVRIGQVVADQREAQRRLAVLVRESQDERRNNVARSCREQNARHDATVRTLDMRLGMLTASPKQRAAAKRSRDFTVALIDALAPRRPNCIAYAETQVRRP